MKRFFAIPFLALFLLTAPTGCELLKGGSTAPLTAQQVTYKSIYAAILGEDQAMKNWYRLYRIKEKDNEKIKDSNPALYEGNKKVLDDKLNSASIAHASFTLATSLAVDNWIKARLAAGENVPITPEKLVPVTSGVQEAIDRVNRLTNE